MAVKIELKRSAVQGKVPTVTQLDLGELAVNTYDGRVFFKQQTNTTQSIIELATTTGTGSVIVSASYANTSSYSFFAESALSSSYANTSSFAFFAATASSGLSSSYAVTSSYSLTSETAYTASTADSFYIRQNLTASNATFLGDVTGSNALFSGTITAQRLVVQVITSSTEFVTGSTIFGSQLTDTHQFTGSVTITGSLAVNGDPVITSASYNTFSASIAGRATNLESTASVLTSASASFAANSGSNSIRFTNLETTASVLTSASASFAADSGSNSTRITNLESTSSVLVQASASFSSSIASLSSSFVAFSQSYNTGSFTGSFYGYLYGTASWAVSASHAPTSLSSSYAISASHADLSDTTIGAPYYTTTASFNSFTQSYYQDSASFSSSIAALSGSNQNLSASIASLSASFVSTSGSLSASIALLSGSFTSFSQSYNTGSFTGSFYGYLYGTSSWAVSASHAPTSLTASYAISASHSDNSDSAISSSYSLSGSYALTASFALNVPVTSSFAVSASHADNADNAISSSYAATASSADDFLVRGNLTGSNALFTGTITAQTLNVQQVTSSIVYSSGSNIFGNQLTDVQQMTGSVRITGSLEVNGIPVVLSNQTSSMTVLSASFAITSSYSFFAVSSSNTVSSSYALSSSNAVSSSYAISSSNALSASYALSSSHAISADSSSIAVSSSYAISSSNSLSSSYANSASVAISSSYALSSSNAVSASYALSSSVAISSSYALSSSNSVSASYALSSSVAISSSYALSSSNAVSASYAFSSSNSITSSFAITASYASNVPETASYALNALSSSYAITASFALNGGGGGVSAIYIADEGILQGTASYFDFVGAGVTATIASGTASINIPGGGGGGGIIGQNAILSQSIAATTWSFTHNLGTQYPVFTIFDINNDVVVPERIYAASTSSAFIYFGSARAGYAVASLGGGIVSASHSETATTASYSFTSSFGFFALTSSIATSTSFASTASYALTSSFGFNALTASIATSSSFSTTSSYALSSSVSVTSSYALSASYAFSSSAAVSSSYALTASYAENITISGSIVDVDYIDFDTSVSYTLAEGRLGWDSGEGTLQLGLEGGNVQYALAEQMYQYVYNDEPTTLTKGQVVLVSGSQGNKIAVKLASNQGDPTSAGTLGLVAETITSGGNGWVITEGPLRKLNTLGLTAGALLFLSSTPGAYTQTPPTAPSHSVRLGYVERVSATVGSIYVKIDNGYELGELHDIVDTTTTSSYGDLLVKSGSVWINSKQLTGSYGLTGSLTATGGGFTGSLLGTATNAVTASFASTIASGLNITASNLLVNNNITASSITAQSASFGFVQTITGSAVIIGQEFIILNTQIPAARYAGLQIYDSGSSATASIVWDSETNHFVYQNASGSTYSGGGFLAGPKNTGSLADITYPTFNKVIRSQGDDHLYNSNITDDDARVSISIPLVVTGSIIASSFTGSLFGTASASVSASYALSSSVAVSASYALSSSNAISSSYAISSSNALSSSYAISSSNSLSSSFAISGSQSVSSSFASTASFVQNAQSSSVATSASYALTASFALNGGGGGISAIYIADEGTLIGSASYFNFIGNNVSASVTNNTASITIIGATGTAALTQSVAAATWSFTHNLNTYTPLIQVYDSSYNQLLPNAISGITPNLAEIRFDYSQSGYAIASNGGPLTVSGSTAQLNQSVAATTWSFAHNLNSRYVNFEVYDSNNYVIIPSNILAVDVNNANLYFATPTSGTAIAMFSGINGAPNATTASYALSASSAAGTFDIGASEIAYASVNSSINGSNTIFSQVTGSFTSGFYKYTAYSQSNARSGEVIAVWNGSSVEYVDTSTADIGSTTNVTMSVALSGNQAQFRAQTNSAGWTIKSQVVYI